MTRKTDKAMAREEAYRLARQEKIRTLHPDKLAENLKKLCPQCWAKDCFLIPVTLVGEDCPYFNPNKPVQV